MAEAPYGFTRRSVERIGKVVRKVEQMPTDLTGRSGKRGSHFAETCWGRLTSEGGVGPPDLTGYYAWTEVYRDADTADWIAVTDGRTGTPDNKPAFEANGAAGVIGEVYLMRRANIKQPPAGEGEENHEDWKPGWSFTIGDGLMRVALVTDGGTVGSNDPVTAPDLTYTVKTRDGLKTLATLQAPLVRLFNHKVTAATWGYADYEGDTLVLIEALEVPDMGAC